MITRLSTILLLGLTVLLSPLAVAQSARSFQLAGYTVTVEGDLGSFSLDVVTRTAAPGVEIATLVLASQQAVEPPHFALAWSLPSVDVVGRWTSNAYFNKTIDADWGPSGVRAMLARGAPVLCLFGNDDGNRLTFAVSDALNTSLLTTGVREENGQIMNRIELFTERHAGTTRYEAEIRFDARPVDYAVALRGVSEWWESHPGYEPAPVPEVAREPMYSTWYSYHQNVSSAELLPEIEAGKTFGLASIIIDDGWQTDDSNRGYAYTGDWEPVRMTDIGEFVEAAHQLGVMVLLWYAVPLVGEKSKIFDRFKGKYLRQWKGQGAWELDPRYPEVRRHIIDTYRKALADWNLDGFKLDFMARFVANDTTRLELGDGRDFASVNEATDRLMTDVMAELRAINPDIMIEFRQPYIGPLMRKYGNMFRAGDSPNAAVANRVRTVDLRLLSGSTAVHSDMLMWRYDEPVDVAALQLLNVLFSVPQISVRLKDIPAEHLAMLQFYIEYWRENRDVLLDGVFRAKNPLANYPLVRASGGGKEIIAFYEDVVAELSNAPDIASIDLINGTRSDALTVRVAGSGLGSYVVSTYTTTGMLVEKSRVELGPGVHALSVTPSGMVQLQREQE